MEITTATIIKLALGVSTILFFACYRYTFRIFGIVVIPEDKIGIVNKRFVLVGANKTLPDGRIIALNGEAGVQADTLAPGLHFWFWPWQYEVAMIGFTTVPEGQLGIVEARDGAPLTGGRVLARHVDCDSFQDARAFLASGERGPQITVIPPGTYRINVGLFSVMPAKATDIPDNMVGVVTTKEGVPLATGDIAGPEVAGHNAFQDGQKFITSGGKKGLQEQVILAGRYFINPRFATIELVEMTKVPIANVGVVIAYVGREGHDVTGDAFKHGNLVARGEKGVWVEALDPGKYPINPYTHKVELVPTANVVLNWADAKTEAHNLDKNLSTITVRSSDGFKFNLDVSQIIHIPRGDAPKVIARFGSVANLVTQVLEPTIGNYFRNAAQNSDVIDFLRNRQQRQDDAKKQIGGALDDYNVGAVDTLIGDITPPDDLMKTLTDRKLAEQQKVTYGTQQMAQVERQKLAQAQALADTQPTVVAAERQVQIKEFSAQAQVKEAEGVAKAKTINAEADAQVTTVTGNAEAAKTTAVGTAQAAVIRLKTEAVGQNNYAVMEVGRALAANHIKLVPEITVVGNSDGGEGSGNSLVNVLLAGLIKDRIDSNGKAAQVHEPE